MNVFEAVKQSVTTRQAADMYGVKVRRGGMACCIFHDDRTPSMKVDNRFHCFGCGADGDVIDFTAQLFGIGVKEAAERLAFDMGIAFDSKNHSPPRPKKRQPTQQQLLKQTADHCFLVLCDYLHLLERWEKEYAPSIDDENWHPKFVEALQKKSYIEYLTDVLLSGTDEEKALLVIEQRKEVIQLEQRIRNTIARDGTGVEADSRSNGSTEVR